jgi:hypothetical protein
MALHEPRLQTPEGTVPLTGIYDVIKRFNRNTTWVATALLGSVLFAALIVAFQERHAKADDLTKEARQTTGDLLNANPAAISEVVDSKEKSTGEMTSAQATSVDRGLTPEINHRGVPATASSWSPANRLDSGWVIRPKMPNLRRRTFVRHRILDVKMRLIALWHQSLMSDEQSRGWTPFSNSNKWRKKNISYTAATSH